MFNCLSKVAINRGQANGRSPARPWCDLTVNEAEKAAQTGVSGQSGRATAGLSDADVT